MNLKRWIIPGIGIALVIALSASAFILVNFSAMSSQMAHDSTLVSSAGTTQSIQPINPTKTGLLVTGENRLAGALQNQIIHQLQSNPAIGQFQVFNGSIDRVNYPVLLIEIEAEELLWTPMYARAILKVYVSYASDGDISFRLNQPAYFQYTGDQPAIKQSGVYAISDISWGIISSPGYINYISREIAQFIVADLKAK